MALGVQSRIQFPAANNYWYCTEKAVPSADNADGTAVPPLGSTIVNGSFGHELIEPVPPRPVAEQFDKLTVPKFASGNILPEEGASTTHSAEDRAAEATVV
jgi:hypothetical protein